ncbi:glycosyltransferase family 2 protein [Sphingobacterium sp. SRCM116780]|uniref:glycosyltransferase family 2 protein n=1 Tax=Sphingobacterium sp. SRCM116780 TaxID=2907623 RepID=UPI001F3925CB|nr:glycosyltransferase family 2 protein [Sphingobacterium sp. SRCM116780]UIR56306.1 glycosyltransferase family 2 protein [Sphingobacterium sp. SRCM116780]
MPKAKISAFIITFNEENKLAQTLKKLTWCDEIVVLDSYSTDRTVEIAKEFGAKVIFQKFEGFGKQKQSALEACQYTWKLSVDADEVLDDLLISNIQKVLCSESKFKAYYIKRRQVFMGKIFKYGDESARKILRLVSEEVRFTKDIVHEVLKYEGEIGVLDGYMLHDSYASYDAYVNTMNKYTNINAEKAYSKGKNYSILEVLIKPKFQFFRKYILNLNFLNGVEGYYWSKLSAYYVFLKCLKVREYYKKAR